ncbi:zinc finger protein 777-like isoform X2 [Ambystoma mexicanum]|uniref:zinc finger protein 777-like isoform X2 n=1 Tax=Ambystoma mexicanum TaxID=8296 RepID=UPI0037E7195C
MSLRDSEKVPVTFQDVASCFSEEEWKLLHQWQKELYKNVMNEIQQALISLGPLIATSVFSLRAKEKDTLCSLDNHDSDGRRSDTNSPSYPMVNPDTSVRINIREETNLWDAEELERTAGINESASYGYPPIHPDMLLQMQQEDEMDSADWSGSEGSDVRVCPSKGFQPPNADVSWRKESDSSTFLMAHPGAKRKRSAIPGSGNEVISFIIKDEQDAYSLGLRNFANREIIDISADDPAVAPVFTLQNEQEDEMTFRQHPESDLKSIGDRTMSRIDEESVNFTGKTNPPRFSSEKAKMTLFHKSRKGTTSISRKWPEKTEELKEESDAQCESSFSNSSDSKLNQEMVKVDFPDKFIKSESPDSETFLNYPPKVQESWHPFAEREQSFFHRGGSTVHHRTSSDNIIYQCAECLKSFSGKTPYLKHQRTHHRSYQCAQCGKSFSCKYHLIRHQTKHTGEKPYQCDECEKCFTQKGSLTIHQRIHSGERPYKCTECDSCFREKKHLVGHFKKAHNL